jgi:hypothetical protein
MGNRILLISSLFFGYIHVSLLHEYSPHIEYPLTIGHPWCEEMPHTELYKTLILTGVVTSILNHATTSNLAIWSDRCLMTVGFVVDLSLSKRDGLPILLGSVLMYFLSKRYQNIFMNVLAQYLLTIYHIGFFVA